MCIRDSRSRQPRRKWASALEGAGAEGQHRATPTTPQRLGTHTDHVQQVIEVRRSSENRSYYNRAGSKGKGTSKKILSCQQSHSPTLSQHSHCITSILPTTVQCIRRLLPTVGLSIHAHMHVHLWTFVLWLLSASVCENVGERRLTVGNRTE